MMRRTWPVALAGAVLAAGVVLHPAAAWADEEEPDLDALLARCNDGSQGKSSEVCEFHPSGPPAIYLESEREVTTSPAFNCNEDSAVPLHATWEDARGETDWWQIKLSVEAKSAFVKTGFSVFYKEEESTTYTTEQRYNINVPALHKGQVYQQPLMQEVQGVYELHFEDKEYGHYIWYIPKTVVEPIDDDEVGDNADGRLTNRMSHTTEPMTDSEIARHC